MAKPGDNSQNPRLFVIYERDAGLFSLIQQVISNVPRALKDDRIPVVHFTRRCAYWTDQGYAGRNTVWEYYFEPVIKEFPAGRLTRAVKQTVENPPVRGNPLEFTVNEQVIASNHFGDHPSLAGRSIAVPSNHEPAADIRRACAEIIGLYVRERAYIRRKVADFRKRHLTDGPVIGVHIRGTDALSAEPSVFRQAPVSLSRYDRRIDELRNAMPNAKILVASDETRFVDHFKQHYGDRVVSYDAMRHGGGIGHGHGPTGELMPRYVVEGHGAQNGEEALIEHLLLRCCDHLIHNGSNLAHTVLLARPELASSVIKAYRPVWLKRVLSRYKSILWRRRRRRFRRAAKRAQKRSPD
jgi:hypothetical protein